MLSFGTTGYATLEAMDLLREDGISVDSMRVKAFPFHQQVKDFIDNHEYIIIVEQNRDAQFRSLLINELELDPARVLSILNYDGMPITAQTIKTQLVSKLQPA